MAQAGRHLWTPAVTSEHLRCGRCNDVHRRRPHGLRSVNRRVIPSSNGAMVRRWRAGDDPTSGQGTWLARVPSSARRPRIQARCRITGESASGSRPHAVFQRSAIPSRFALEGGFPGDVSAFRSCGATTHRTDCRLRERWTWRPLPRCQQSQAPAGDSDRDGGAIPPPPASGSAIVDQFSWVPAGGIATHKVPLSSIPYDQDQRVGAPCIATFAETPSSRTAAECPREETSGPCRQRRDAQALNLAPPCYRCRSPAATNARAAEGDAGNVVEIGVGMLHSCAGTQQLHRALTGSVDVEMPRR
jgi:hypothetical protein